MAATFGTLALMGGAFVALMIAFLAAAVAWVWVSIACSILSVPALVATIVLWVKAHQTGQ
jgi:hypothetical protein